MTSTAQADPHPLFSHLAGQFSFQKELGRGGMGVVYLARDEKLERLAAIKVLPPDLTDNADVRTRFLREARIAGQLSHPNIVPIYRADEIEGNAFFVMAYVEGESLGDRVRDRGALPPTEVANTLREVAWALAYAHARGLIHRDVKPENILLEKGTGRALVTDFGIARDQRASPLTADGTVLGTVDYMSPEQVSNDELDGRSDLYALGVVGFYALTGRLPFEEATASAALVAHVTKRAPKVRDLNPLVPASIAAVIDRCLEKDPADRFASGEALAEALTKAVEDAGADPAEGEAMSRVVSETQAAAIWKRAAQLQAEALQRLEASVAVTRHLSGGHSLVASDGADGYRMKHVQEAAEEAGISRQFVALALAEMSPGEAVANITPTDARMERVATILLGKAERSLSVSRVITGNPRKVLEAIGSLLQREPFSLMLRETIGGHPLDGGVMVFDLPGTMTMGVTISTTSRWFNTKQALEAKQVQVTMKSLGGDRTEVSMFVDLRPGIKPNAMASGVLSGIVGSVGSIISTAGTLAAVKAATGIVALASAGPAAALGFIAFGGATAAWYRWLYPRMVRKAAGEMRDALDAVEGAMRAQEIFGSSPDMIRRLPTLGDR